MSVSTFISIIVPTHNNEDQIAELVESIHTSLEPASGAYEIIVVDDNSTDLTLAKLLALKATHPLRLLSKIGKPGKTASILQGIHAAQSDTICLIDPVGYDSPEAIIPMTRLIQNHNADIVVSHHEQARPRSIYAAINYGVDFIFCRLLLGVNHYRPSSLKICQKHIFKTLNLKPSTANFNLELFVKAKRFGFNVMNYAPQAVSSNALLTSHISDSLQDVASSALKLKYELFKTRKLSRDSLTIKQV
jgi:glycosyltransferase involved in cell wall biosynthesis